MDEAIVDTTRPESITLAEALARENELDQQLVARQRERDARIQGKLLALAPDLVDFFLKTEQSSPWRRPKEDLNIDLAFTIDVDVGCRLESRLVVDAATGHIESYSVAGISGRDVQASDRIDLTIAYYRIAASILALAADGRLAAVLREEYGAFYAETADLTILLDTVRSTRYDLEKEDQRKKEEDRRLRQEAWLKEGSMTVEPRNKGQFLAAVATKITPKRVEVAYYVIDRSSDGKMTLRYEKDRKLRDRSLPLTSIFSLQRRMAPTIGALAEMLERSEIRYDRENLDLFDIELKEDASS